MSIGRVIVALAMLAGALLAWSAPAGAQATPEERRAAARALFQEGVALSAQERWADAEDRFRRALTVERLAVVAYNLGVALERQSRLVEAAELLREAARDPGRAGESARAALAQVEPRIPQLDLEVRGLVDGDTVLLDGAPRERALLGVSLPVDPGRHRVEVHRAGETVAYQDFVLIEGARVPVSLEVPPPPRPLDVRPALPRGGGRATRRLPSPTDRLPPDEDERSGGGGVLSQWWFWAAVGTVVVGATVTVVVVASDGRDPYQGNFMPRALEVD